MGWDKLREQRLQRMKELGVVPEHVSLSLRDPNVPAWKDEQHKAWQQKRMEVYAAQITAMDRGIGEVMEALKKNGRFENTLILYTIDNGGCHVEYGQDRKGDYLPEKTRDGRPMIPGNIPNVMPGPENTYQSYGYGWANVSNTPYRLFKQFDHEGGIHTPMIAHWPAGIKNGGRVVRQVSHLVDIMPTVLDASAVTKPTKIGETKTIAMDGMSLTASFTEAVKPIARTLYFHHAKGRAMRAGKWKLVNVQKSDWELYDLDADPIELNDLAAQMPAKVNELSKQWDEWSKRQSQRNKS